jgi:hypothetical protein
MLSSGDRVTPRTPLFRAGDPATVLWVTEGDNGAIGVAFDDGIEYQAGLADFVTQAELPDRDFGATPEPVLALIRFRRATGYRS